MGQQNIADGGLQFVPQIAAVQYVYLDFDGELTDYRGEILTVENVVVEHPELSEERIEYILTELNKKYAAENIVFVTEIPEEIAEYSTIYIGKTEAFNSYGSFAGLAETLDKNNENKTDKAFVMLNATNSNEEIIAVITHETNHLIGTLNHGGEGINAYAANTIIGAGTTSTGLIISVFNSVTVSSGGVANNTTVNGGGSMYISSGGVANSTTAMGGEIYIFSGGVANSTLIKSGADIYIYNSGTANYTSVYPDCTMHISSGVIANYTSIYNAKMYISTGAIASISLVSDAGVMYVQGGTAYETTVVNAQISVCSGGLANNTNLHSYASMVIENKGSADEITVSSGAYLYISSGGTATGITWTPCFGDVHVEDGATVTFTSIPSGIYLLSNSSISRALTITGKLVNETMYILSKGVANKTVVNRTMKVASGGIANSTTVSAYGYMYIYNSGVANDTTMSGGTMHISSGGTANSTTGGYMYISSGGTANSTTVNNGLMYISSSGVANSTTVNYGLMYISSGGVANSTTVHSGGNMSIYSGGVANSTTVSSDGYMYISSGGVANSTTVNYGGDMNISSGGVHSGSLQIESGAFVSAYSGAKIDFTVADRATSDDYLINNLSLITGAPTYTITVSADQWFGEYKLAQGAENFTGTISVGDGTADYGTITVNGAALTSNDVKYTLTQTNGNLLLNITDNRPPAVFIYSSGTLTSSGVEITGATLVSGGNNSMHISSGGVVNSTTVNSSGYMRINSGGVANSTTVNYDGGMYISSGGTALIIKENGGYVNVADGANVTFASNTITGMTLSNTLMTVHQNTVANSTTVNYYGLMRISSGGVANSTTVNSGGSMDISSGGTANSTTVDGGYMYISSGGIMLIHSGGVANDTTMYGGSMHISSGGTATDITAQAGAYLYITVASDTYIQGTYNGSAFEMKDAFISGHTVNSRCGMHISSGGTATDITAQAGARLYITVASDTYIQGTYNGSAFEMKDAFIAWYTVHSGGKMHISSGGVANRTTVNSWGFMHISSGGVANSTTVNSWGYMHISSGGTANSTTINDWGYMHISSGGTANSTTINDWSEIYISSGGVVNDTTMSHGKMYISSGGTANFTEVNSGGSMVISSGGVANDTTMYGGSMHISSGGVANSTTGRGDMYISSGGTANSTTVRGVMYISNGGVANSTTVSDGSMDISSGGVANNTTLSGYSATMYISSGGTANITTVNFGCDMRIFSGGTANSTTINSNGSMRISSGGVANSTTINSRGSMYIASGGTANSTTINDWSKMYISSGGVANSTTINSGGSMYIASGGTANSTTVNSGGSMDIYSGVVANSTTVKNSGSMCISSGGTANSTTVDGGDMYIYNGGVANNTTVNYGGDMYISSGGTALAIKENGGYVAFADGANVTFASNTITGMTLSYASMTVHQNTIANSTTVNRLGKMYISNGGVANCTTVNYGGKMHISSGGVHRGSLEIADGAVVSAYEGGIIDFTVVDRTTSDDYLINDLSLITGAPTYTITVSADQAFGEYKLAQGAENFTGTISVGNGSTEYGTLTVNGAALNYNNVKYTLTQTNGNLLLNVVDYSPKVFIYSSGTLTSSGTEITGATLVSGGNDSMYISSGGVVDQTVVSSGGVMYISSGGLAADTAVSGGNLTLAGGTVTNVTLYDGGSINSGAITALSGSVGQIGSVSGSALGGSNCNLVLTKFCTLQSGASLENANVYALHVSSGATVSNITAYKKLSMRTGAAASHIVMDGGHLDVNSFSGSVTDLTLKNSGCISGKKTLYAIDGKEGHFDTLVVNNSRLSWSGTAENIVLTDYYNLSSGMTLENSEITNSGSIRVSAGAVVNNTVVYNNGYIDVFSGGSISNIEFVGSDDSNYGYGELDGGTATNVTLSGGGYLQVYKNGYVSGVTILDKSHLDVYNGTVEDAAVSYGGRIVLDSTGKAANTVISSGGSLNINGGSAENTVVSSGGQVQLGYEANASMTDLVLAQGGLIGSVAFTQDKQFENIEIVSGAVNIAPGVVIRSHNSMYVTDSGSIDHVYLNSAFMTLSNGGTADSTVVSGYAIMYVSQGGVANNTQVYDGGYIDVYSGGTVNSTTINANAKVYLNAGTANHTVINSNASMTVDAGGTASNTEIYNNASLTLSGRADSTTVKSGGVMNVWTNGRANNTTINHGKMIVSSGSAINTIVENGSIVLSQGGKLSNTTLQSGAVITRNGAAFLEGKANGGSVEFVSNYQISGSVENIVFHNNYVVLQSASLNNCTITGVNAYGSAVIISSGNYANNTVITQYGSMTVDYSGTAENTIIQSGGVMSHYNGNVENVVIHNGGEMYYEGGNAVDITLEEGGRLYYVNLGSSTTITARKGSAVIEQIGSDGLDRIFGSIANVSLVSGNIGLGSSAVLSDSEIACSMSVSGGKVVDSIITSGGNVRIFPHGSMEQTLIESSGYAQIMNSAYAGNITLQSRGRMQVNGYAENTVVNAWGNLQATGSGIVENTVVTSGGSMTLRQTAVHRGTLEISSGATVNFTELAILDFTVSNRTAADGYLVNDLSLINGLPIYTITVAADQARGTYKLAQGAENFDFTISIGDGTTTYGTLSANGEVLSYNGNDYLLIEESGNLELLIADLTAPELVITGNAENWTNRNVVLFAETNETSTIEYLAADGQWTLYTDNGVTVTGNTTVKFKATDLAGNVTEKEVVVDKIDKTDPDMPLVTADIIEVTNKAVSVTAEFSADSVVKEYSLNGSDWNVYTAAVVFTENGKVYFRGQDEAGNYSNVAEYTISNIDKVAPTLEFSGNATAWTNKDVTLTAVVSDGTVEYYNGSKWVAGNKYTVSENGTYKFRVTDAAGNVTEKSVTVDKIDKIAPTLEISNNPTAWTNKDVTLTAVVSDGTVEYYNGSKWVAGNKYTVSENGTYKFRVTDAAGNVTEKSVTVDKIDKVAPTLKITGNATAWTSKDVTLTAVVSDGTVEYYNGSKWVVGDKYTVSANGTYKFRVTDAAGNVTEKSVTVDKIDKIAPEKPLASADVTLSTNGNVTVTAEFSTDSVVKEYSYNGIEWVTYTGGISFTNNGTICFRGQDEAGNYSNVTEYTVSNIDKLSPAQPENFTNTLSGYNALVSWNTVADIGVAGIKGYEIRYSFTSDLTACESIFVDKNEILLSDLAVGVWYYQILAVDHAGNKSEWSTIQNFEVTPGKPAALQASPRTASWQAIAGVEEYIVEYSVDNFKTVMQFTVHSNSMDTISMPMGNYQWRVKAVGGDFTVGNEIFSANTITAPAKYTSDEDGCLDVFFVNTQSKWTYGYSAQHLGFIGGWEGTGEKVSLAYKNRTADIFVGSDDANVLVLTDDKLGDALFVDDIFTALGDQARLSQIDEIRAGAGDDVVDMTSQQFSYVGDGVKIYGGLGNDTIWANNGENTLFGDAGNDRIIGGSGDDVIVGGIGNDRLHGGGGEDVFCFGDNWGKDSVEQLADGKVTLLFESGSLDNWNEESLTYIDGDNRVVITGVSKENIEIVFADELAADDLKVYRELGVFEEFASEKIFEDKNKGTLA